MTTAVSTQGSNLYFPDESVSPAVVSPVAQMTGFTGLGGKKTKIDITTMDSNGVKEYAGGLLDAGELTFDLIWNFTLPNHILVAKLAAAGNATLPFFYGASDGVTIPTITGTEALGTVALSPPVTTSPVKYSRSGFAFNGYFSSFVIDVKIDSVIMVHAAVQQTGAIKTIVKGATPS
jgi:hypothetical protein